MTKRKFKAGDVNNIEYVVHVDFGIDKNGKYWWFAVQQDGSPVKTGGPFVTEAAAQRDAEVAIFGSQCQFEDGGQWDPNWEQKQ